MTSFHALGPRCLRSQEGSNASWCNAGRPISRRSPCQSHRSPRAGRPPSVRRRLRTPPRRRSSDRRRRRRSLIALRIHLNAPVSRERFPQQPPVVSEHVRVPVAKLVEQACRPLDVGEEEGDGAGRKLGHGPPTERRRRGAFPLARGSHCPNGERATNCWEDVGEAARWPEAAQPGRIPAERAPTSHPIAACRDSA
jgi:hypothetical protein